MTLTSIVSCVRAPILLVERAGFLVSHLFRDSNVIGIGTSALTCAALSGGLLSTFLGGLFLGVGICYYFFNVLKNAQQFPNALGKQVLRKIVLILPGLGAHAKEEVR